MNSEDSGNLEYTRIENELIIGFNLWGEKRICLPQLLRSVLSEFDINIIDKAVTDLQINCFQCNAVQMDVLHDNNVLPKQIVRCGLIRKSDAERLCKYLLQPNQNFTSTAEMQQELSRYPSIQVIHTCFGQQSGTLYPVLYSSPDAKCIKCSTCENLFKTYEFVGHTHKLDEVSSTYHWGFDSSNWRLLLQVYSTDKSKICDLSEMKGVLDKIKILFYEEELKSMMKSSPTSFNVLWRPSRKFKLPNLQKNTECIKPPHLKEKPSEIYQRSVNKGLVNAKLDTFVGSGYVPNVYLKAPDGNFCSSESSIEDDDLEEVEENSKSTKSAGNPALHAAEQIKKEITPKDLISLGAINLFLSQKDDSINNRNTPENQPNKYQKESISPIVVAQTSTSIPPQYLMLEALWSQLFRDIIQMTHLISFSNNDERSRIISQLFRCQDIFKTQWMNMAEENKNLKEKVLVEQKRRQEIEVMYEKLISTLKETTVEKKNLTELVKQLEIEIQNLGSKITSGNHRELFSEPNSLVNVDCKFEATNRPCVKRHRNSSDCVSDSDADSMCPSQYNVLRNPTNKQKRISNVNIKVNTMTDVNDNLLEFKPEAQLK